VIAIWGGVCRWPAFNCLPLLSLLTVAEVWPGACLGLRCLCTVTGTSSTVLSSKSPTAATSTPLFPVPQSRCPWPSNRRSEPPAARATSTAWRSTLTAVPAGSMATSSAQLNQSSATNSSGRSAMLLGVPSLGNFAGVIVLRNGVGFLVCNAFRCWFTPKIWRWLLVTGVSAGSWCAIRIGAYLIGWKGFIPPNCHTLYRKGTFLVDHAQCGSKWDSQFEYLPATQF